jgi:hypothetical protein
MGFLLKRRENVKTTNHFFLLPPRRRNEKAFSNDALSQRTLSSSFFLFRRASRCAKKRTNASSRLFFSRCFGEFAFFFAVVCGEMAFLCERTQTRNEKVHVRVRIIGSLAAAFGVKNINTARANAIRGRLMTTREKRVSRSTKKYYRQKKRGYRALLL